MDFFGALVEEAAELVGVGLVFAGGAADDLRGTEAAVVGEVDVAADHPEEDAGEFFTELGEDLLLFRGEQPCFCSRRPRLSARPRQN